MIVRASTIKIMRRSLLACASTIVLGMVGEAAAQTGGPSVQIVRQSTEIANGKQVTSVSRDMLVARKRVGDRSLLVYDRQNGAMTVERGGEVAVQPLVNSNGIDASFAYDYATQTFSGDETSARTFNTFFKPVVLQGPKQGVDARWSVATSLAAIGVDRTPGDLALNLSRRYVQVDGKSAVLFEFEFPAFQYRTPRDEVVIHWGRGFALTDADFSTVYALGTQHRASVMEKGGEMRPVSVRTAMHGVDKAGGWTINLAQAPQVTAAVARVNEVAGEDGGVHLVAAVEDTATVDAFPVMLARYLDMMALAAAEGGANPLPSTYGAGTMPDGGPAGMGGGLMSGGTLGNPSQFPQIDNSRTETAAERAQRLADENAREQLDDPYGLRQPTETDTTRVIKHVRVNREAGAQPQTPEEAKQELSDLYQKQKDLLVRSSVLNSSLRDAAGNLTPGARDEIETDRQRRLEMLRNLERYINNDYDNMPLNPDDKVFIYKKASARDLGLNNFWNDNPWVSETDYGDTAPTWIDPGSADMATYRDLVASLQQSIAEITALLDRDADRRSGDASIDAFYDNNAFDYMSMVGIVETDLSRWGEWLASQDVRELERLAKLAGYPNLASALADAQNLIRQAEDPGYRRWAMQAPSCNGLAGCGPSYLERWWMKQSVVALGDILASSRDIFSTGGFSDIGMSGLNLNYLLRDHSLEDGDIVQVKIMQFGRTIYQGQVNLTNLGEVFNQQLGRGVASLEIFAVNEGYSPPNTAQIRVDNVVRGAGTQTYSLRTGETATLRIEAGAIAAPGGTP